MKDEILERCYNTDFFNNEIIDIVADVVSKHHPELDPESEEFEQLCIKYQPTLVFAGDL